MKIAYNPLAEAALTTAPSNNDITFDLAGKAIYAKGVKFKGTDTTYSVFKKHTSDNEGGYNGLVPVPSYTTTTTRYLKEDGTWDTPNYKVWTAYAGVDYTGWVTLVEWKMSKQDSFSPKPFMFSIHRNYNSPASESYTFSITSGYDTATIALISGNARARIIEQIRIVKCEDAKTYKLEMFVDEARRTYKNTCTCIVYGYSDFIGTTTCVKNTDNDVTVLTQIPTVSGKLVGTITNADLANTLNYIKLPSCGDKTSNSVWCKFAKLTFNRSSYDCVSGYLFFSGSESIDNKGILYYLFRCSKETDEIGMGNLQWLVKSNSSIEVIAKKIEPCVYNLYINNLNPWTTPIIHNLASTGSFTWDVGEWGSKPEVDYVSTDIGRVNYSNDSLKLNRTVETDVNSCYEDLKLRYYTLSGCNSSTSTNGKRYAGTANSYGFPVSNNANSMLWLGSHSTNYGHQLGFSSDGRIYDRYISNGSFSTSVNGGSWNKIAWTHEIPTKISQLTNDSGFLTQHQSLENYVTLNTALTITGAKNFDNTVLIRKLYIDKDTDKENYYGVRLLGSDDIGYLLLGQIEGDNKIHKGAITGINNTNLTSLEVKSGNTNFLGDLTITSGNTDKFINFSYNSLSAHSWRLGYLGTGNGDANYFVVLSGKADGTSWNNAIRLGNETLDAAFGGNVYPLFNNQTLGTATDRWSGLYSNTGNFSGNVTAVGFIKTNSSDSYVLLGGGSHKALSNFALIDNGNLSINLYNDLIKSGTLYSIKVLNNNISSTKSWCVLLLHPDTTSTTNILSSGYAVDGEITLYRRYGACISNIKITSCAGHSSSWNNAVLEINSETVYSNFKLVTCTYNNTTYRAISFYASQDIELSQFRGFHRTDSNFGKIIVTTDKDGNYNTNSGVTNILDYSNDGLKLKQILASDLKINGNSVIHTGNYTSYLDGRYYTESEIDTKLNSYLPLLGGLMDSNAYISWNNGADGNDVSDWKKITGNGLRIISSSTTTSNAPTQYSTALHIKGRYGFQLASLGGAGSNNFYIRNISNDNWNDLIHSGNISSQSVNYATSAGNADKLDNLHSSAFKETWEVSAGGSYTGWITIAKWTISDEKKAGNFTSHPFMLSIRRAYNSPAPESYTFSLTFGWDTATITQISGNAKNRIIENIRIAKSSNSLTYNLEIYVNTSYETYQNTCYCVAYGYYGDSFSGTTCNEKSSGMTTVLAQLTTASNAMVGNLVDSLKKVTVPNNTNNDFNTFKSMTLTGRGDPTTGASLSNAPWTGAGPAGGYGVLTYLWSGYGTLMAWGYNSNRIYIRPKYYANSTATWSSTWDSLALTSDLKNPTDYYWANVKVSSSSDSETAPTFATATATTSVVTPLVNSTGRLTLNATNTGLDLKFSNDNTKSVILNGSAFKPFDAATEKLSLGTSSARWSALYSGTGNFTGDVTLLSSTGDSPKLYFVRGGSIGDKGALWDWRMYSSSGYFYLLSDLGTGTWSTLLFINTNNNVGIGTTSPVYKLDVAGSGKFSTYLNLNNQRFNYGLAYYNTNTETVTGTIVITLPNSWNASMNTYEIDLYEYNEHVEADDNKQHSKIIISGYNYSGSSRWVNYGYQQVGSYNKGVRLGYNGSKCCILLGTTTTEWKYPQVHLSRVITGYSNQTAWSTGYSISVITDETEYSKIVSVDRTRQRFDDVVANNFRGNLVGNASTASKLGSSTLGGTYEPIYLSSGTATTGTSYAKAIKSITRSGTTFTYTCIDGSTGTFTQLDSNSTYPVYSKTAKATTTGWYRIAQSPASISRCLGTFEIEGSVSGYHTVATVLSGINYSLNPFLNVINTSHYGTGALTKVRIVYHTTYTDKYAYLEVYKATSTETSITVKIANGYGWSLCDITTGSIPTDYTYKEISLYNATLSTTGKITSMDHIETGGYLTFGYHGASFDSDVRNSWRTSIYGNAANGSRIRTVRTDKTIDDFSEIYGSGLTWATGDTQGYLGVSYSSGKAWIGGGSGDKLRWSTYLVTGKNIGSLSVNYASSAGNADKLDDLHATSFAIWRGEASTDPTATNTGSTSTADFFAKINATSGLFNSRFGAMRGSWWYVGNTQLDTGVGTLEMAGTAVLNLGSYADTNDTYKSLLFLDQSGRLWSYTANETAVKQWSRYAKTTDTLPINAYNYANGCLVKLNISADSNSMISVHITGNAYSTAMNTKVINSIVEFYNYKDGNDILNYNATHFGYNFGDVKIFNYDNKVCLWFKQDHNYMSFSVFANYTNSGSADNMVLSISNLVMPTSGVTRSKTITPKTIAYRSDIPTKISQLTNDSGYLTQHQSLENYVTLNTALTITGSKTFTASTNTFSGTGASILTVDRNSTNPAWIRFCKNGTLQGYIGITNDFQPVFLSGEAGSSNKTLLHAGNYTAYVNTTNFPGLNSVGDITGVTAGAGLSGGGTSGSVTLTNAGVRSTTINGNYLRVNTNGTNNDLTIPYATNADKVDDYHATSLVRKSVMENNSSFNANSMNTDLVIYTSKGDVGNNTSIWDNFGAGKPAGGFSLFHIKEGLYARQLLGVYNDRHLYIRSQYYSNGAVWSDWNTIALISDITKSQVGLGNVQNTAFYQRNVTVNGTAWNMAGTNNYAAFTIYAPTTAGTAGLILLSNGSGAPVWGSLPGHSHAYLPLAGGTMNNTAIISRKGYSVSWYLGRDGAMIKTTEYNGYNPILSMKTTNGSWDLGVYTGDTAYLTYITDVDHDTPKNTCTYQLTFPKKTGTLAVTSDIPTSLPANGGNAETVDNYHISVVNSLPATKVNNTIYILV